MPIPDSPLLRPPLLRANRKSSLLSLASLREIVRQQTEMLLPRTGDCTPEDIVLLLTRSVNALVKGDAEFNICLAHVGILVVHTSHGELAKTSSLFGGQGDILGATDQDERRECAESHCRCASRSSSGRRCDG